MEVVDAVGESRRKGWHCGDRRDWSKVVGFGCLVETLRRRAVGRFEEDSPGVEEFDYL